MTRHLLVVGAQRCGTTYLATLLDAHPDIAMAQPARPEPKVFLDPEKTARGLEWYRSTYFAHAGDARVLGEKSTSYLEYGEAARAAAKVLGEADIIVLLRDPVERAVSNWRFSVRHGLEDRPLDQALAQNLRGSRDWDRALTSVSPYKYVERGRYIDYLEPWLEQFPGSVHVRFTDEVTGHPEAIAELYGTLGVDPTFRPTGLGERVNAADGSAPALDPALVTALREAFRPTDDRLRERLGRPLPWDR